MSMDAPLILTATNSIAAAKEYAADANVQVTMILGGASLISNEAVFAKPIVIYKVLNNRYRVLVEIIMNYIYNKKII